jgi:hypothetical protein
MESLGRFSLLAILFVVATFSDGYTFSKGWEWFISGNFDIKTLSVMQSVGLAMFIRYSTTKIKAKDLEDSDSGDAIENLVKIFIVSQVINVFFLILGYLVKGLM